MARDCVANIVDELHRRGCNPLRVGHDSWEARCPVHKGTERSLAVGRNELNHVILECRSTQNCPYARIIGALGFTNDRVYAETPEWLISRLSGVPIRPASFKSSNGNANHEVGTSATEGVNGSAETLPPDEGEPGADCVRALTGFHPAGDREAVVVSIGPIASEAAVESTGSSDGASPSQAAPQGKSTPCEEEAGDPKELSASDPSASADIKDNAEAKGSLQVLLRLASGAVFPLVRRAAVCPGAGR